MRTRRMAAAAALLMIGSCASDGEQKRDASALAPAEGAAARRSVDCRADPSPRLRRTELGDASAAGEGRLLLRMVQLSDEHVMDDDGQAVLGASPLDPVEPTVDSAQRMQDEYTDEVLNAMIATVNACDAPGSPIELVVATGDNTDLGTLAELRRFVDNMDGTFDRPSRYEATCRAGLPAGTDALVADLLCTAPSGRGVADTQSKDPDPADPLYRFNPTRVPLQLLDTTAAVLAGETLLRAPGLPPSLRCDAGTPGCENRRLEVPWVAAFGNHDGYMRGTLVHEPGTQEVSAVFGRRYLKAQHEFIDELFATGEVPGPVGHGFENVDAERWNDGDDRNDGYYAFDAGARVPAGRPRMRMIVLNTIVDGVAAGLGAEPLLLRNPLGLADGSIDRAQFEWLRSELAEAREAGQLVLLFSHHPDGSFVEFGTFSALVTPEVTAAELDAELASHPHVVAWIAGHTHRNRIRAFVVAENGVGSNGTVTAPVACRAGDVCRGFWQIETSSLIDVPQEARLLEIVEHGAHGVIRATMLGHGFERSTRLAEADDPCQFHLADPDSLARLTSDADLRSICTEGGTREGGAADRNVELPFVIPASAGGS